MLKSFPKNFLWGSAAAAHQTEGNNIHSNWWAWERAGGTEPSGVACDHYNRFEEDFKIAKSLNQNAHRLSIEWARIEPREGHFDKKEIRHYHRVLDSLKSKDIKSFVSIWHVTLPLWFAQKGGFENSSNIWYLERFARLCAREFGEKVDFWVTVNEPLNYALAAYGTGLWPPQKKGGLLKWRVYLNLVRVHKMLYRVLKEELSAAKAGPALNMNAVHYHGRNPFMALVAWVLEAAFNRSFLLLSFGQFDFIGVNYYFHHDVSLNDLTVEVNKRLTEQLMLLERSDYGSFFYPQGIYEVLMKLKGYRKPIYITENGVADAKDAVRERFIREHLLWAHKAIEDGVDLKGYLYWSLTDNFEWIFGFKPRFGLVKIDYKTQKRTIRKSANFYAKVCKENAIMSDDED